MFRALIGWCVAQGIVLSGFRRRAVRSYDVPNTILSFYGHDPQPKVLDALLSWLTSAGFSFISTDDLLAMSEGIKSWRPRIAWLTFDDGWANFERALLPVLERYHAAATIFVAPGETARGQIWTNAVMPSVSSEDIARWYLLSSKERYAMVDAVLKLHGRNGQLASEAELRRLSRHSLITLENHTYSHLSCSHRPVKEMIAEVQKTQYILKEWSGRTPKLCCYPFGHWTGEADRQLEKIGLLPVHSEPGVMTLKTIGVSRNMFHERMTMAENVGRVLGAWPSVKVKRG